jgi:hypothetical protein
LRDSPDALSAFDVIEECEGDLYNGVSCPAVKSIASTSHTPALFKSGRYIRQILIVLVPTPTHQSPSIRRYGEGENPVKMPREGSFQLTRLQIPNLDSCVTTPTYQSLSIWRYGEGLNRMECPVRVVFNSPVADSTS